MIFVNLVALCSLGLSFGQPSAPKRYGMVVQLTGNVQRKQGENSSELKPYFPVFVNDTLILSPRSIVGIRKEDGKLDILDHKKVGSKVILVPKPVSKSVVSRLEAVVGNDGVGNYSRIVKTAVRPGPTKPQPWIGTWPVEDVMAVPTYFEWVGGAAPDTTLVIVDVKAEGAIRFEKPVPENSTQIQVSEIEFTMQSGRRYAWRLEAKSGAFSERRGFVVLDKVQRARVEARLSEVKALLPDADDIELGLAQAQVLQNANLFADSIILLNRIEKQSKTPLIALLRNAAWNGLRIAFEGSHKNLSQEDLIRAWGG